MIDRHSPLDSLQQGHWFKLICGASFQHLPTIRSLTLAYALAGVDCIDVCADPAVVAMAREALDQAESLSDHPHSHWRGKPWLMVSLNDGEDPHFRKAEFEAATCPSDCPRPCEAICPAQAIVFHKRGDGFSGVIEQRCYGCGRCLPVCPVQKIFPRSYLASTAAIAPLILQLDIDAIEIHTQVGHLLGFQTLWQAIVPWVDRLQLVAISCPDGAGVIEYLRELYQILAPLPCPLVWQTDGRPMSGDIGKGTTHAAVKFGEKILSADLPGYVQLAGGTNQYTVAKLESLGLLRRGRAATLSTSCRHPIPLPQQVSRADRYIAGVAYGSYARTLLLPWLEQLENLQPHSHSAQPVDWLDTQPDLLWQMVKQAWTLVAQLKGGNG